MRQMGPLLAVALALVLAGTSAQAFERVADRESFIETVTGKSLSLTRPLFLRSAVRLQVSPDGDIRGRALGGPVNGDWRWQDGYFCRDLVWGERDLGPNCQMVEVKGNRIRFTSDFGRGDSADFRIE